MGNESEGRADESGFVMSEGSDEGGWVRDSHDWLEKICRGDEFLRENYCHHPLVTKENQSLEEKDGRCRLI